VLITIAICTLNRAESLRRTLGSLATMPVPEGLDWEVVIVNNNCTDHTDDVLNAFAARLPIRREFEPERGHSRARNRAVDAARGEYIVWTDDDVIVDSGWLTAYADAFRRWPDAAVFGGPILPRYEAPVPPWVAAGGPVLAPAFGLRDLGADPVPLSVAEGRDPWGSNFVIRASEQREFRYDPALGYAPGRQRAGDETDVIERILESGALGYWVPAAQVQHCISRERQTLRYVARGFAQHGETAAFREGATLSPKWFGAPRWAWRRLIEGWLLYQLTRWISPAPRWIKHMRGYNYARGTIRYWRSSRSTHQG
jgi:glycosyltransferase involved in cell wall biosynthesis